jgi:hypothetical protein
LNARSDDDKRVKENSSARLRCAHALSQPHVKQNCILSLRRRRHAEFYFLRDLTPSPRAGQSNRRLAHELVDDLPAETLNSTGGS